MAFDDRTQPNYFMSRGVVTSRYKGHLHWNHHQWVWKATSQRLIAKGFSLSLQHALIASVLHPAGSPNAADAGSLPEIRELLLCKGTKAEGSDIGPGNASGLAIDDIDDTSGGVSSQPPGANNAELLSARSKHGVSDCTWIGTSNLRNQESSQGPSQAR